MNVGGGESADQLVRMILAGSETTIRLGGDALKNLLALSMALAKDHKKLYGKVNMRKMLNETRDIRVFTMTPEQYKQFRKLAGKQKILFSAIKDSDGHGLVDVVLPVTELERANVIFERIKYDGEPEQHDQSEQPDQPDQPERSEQPEQPDQSERSDQPEQLDQPEQPNQPEHPDQPEQSNEPSYEDYEMPERDIPEPTPEDLWWHEHEPDNSWGIDDIPIAEPSAELPQPEQNRPEFDTPEGRNAEQETQEPPLQGHQENLKESPEKTVSETKDESQSRPDSPDTKASSNTHRDKRASRTTTNSHSEKDNRPSVEGRLKAYKAQIQQNASAPARSKTKSKVRIKTRPNSR